MINVYELLIRFIDDREFYLCFRHKFGTDIELSCSDSKRPSLLARGLHPNPRTVYHGAMEHGIVYGHEEAELLFHRRLVQQRRTAKLCTRLDLQKTRKFSMFRRGNEHFATRHILETNHMGDIIQPI